MTICKITLLACQWLLLSAQTVADKPPPTVVAPRFDADFFNPRPIAPNYLEYLRSRNVLPPPEYDQKFKGELTVKRGTQNDLRTACPNTFRPGNHAVGCAKRLLDGQICVVYILNDVGLQMVGWDYEIVLRHERGHCNGWQHPQ